MLVIIELSRGIGTNLSAKFEIIKYNLIVSSSKADGK